MTIDIHVHPAFYEPINANAAREELRHRELDIHRNGLAPLEHVFNQMRCASLDRLCLLAQDYSTQMGETLVSNRKLRSSSPSRRSASGAWPRSTRTTAMLRTGWKTLLRVWGSRA